MAYKFQLGNARLGGQVSANGLDAQDSNVTNVGEIAVDKIEADNNELVVDVANSQANAVMISGSASGEMMRFDSTGASTIHVSSDMEFGTNTEANFRAAEQKIYSPATDELAIEASASINFDVNTTSVLRVSDLSLEAKIPLEMSGSQKIRYGENMESGKILVADGTELASVAVSGDATLASNGALTIANDAVTAVKIDILDDSLAATSGHILVGDGTDFGNVAVSGDATLAANGALTLASSQTNVSSLKHASLVVGAASGNDLIDFGTGGSVIIKTDNTARITVTDSDTTISGNLIVDGTTTTVNSTQVEITGSFIFDGTTPGGNKTTLDVVDPTANATIRLPAMAAGTYHVPVLAAASTTAITATPAELNLLDSGVVATSVTIADTDNIILFDDSDSDNGKKIVASSLKSYLGNSSLIDVELKADGDTLVNGFNYVADMSSDGTDVLTLPASPAVGDVVRVKAPSDASATRILQITASGAQVMDDASELDLVSPFAAVNLVYVAANTWRVF